MAAASTKLHATMDTNCDNFAAASCTHTNSIVVRCSTMNAKGFPRTFPCCVNPITRMAATEQDASEVSFVNTNVASILDADPFDYRRHFSSDSTRQTVSFVDQAQPQRSIAIFKEVLSPDHVSISAAIASVRNLLSEQEPIFKHRCGRHFANACQLVAWYRTIYHSLQ